MGESERKKMRVIYTEIRKRADATKHEGDVNEVLNSAPNGTKLAVENHVSVIDSAIVVLTTFVTLREETPRK
jgi:hypothetical protein